MNRRLIYARRERACQKLWELEPRALFALILEIDRYSPELSPEIDRAFETTFTRLVVLDPSSPLPMRPPIYLTTNRTRSEPEAGET
jgi:hypothetical protein